VALPTILILNCCCHSELSLSFRSVTVIPNEVRDPYPTHEPSYFLRPGC
jgi:hypothetical protein